MSNVSIAKDLPRKQAEALGRLVARGGRGLWVIKAHEVSLATSQTNLFIEPTIARALVARGLATSVNMPMDDNHEKVAVTGAGVSLWYRTRDRDAAPPMNNLTTRQLQELTRLDKRGELGLWTQDKKNEQLPVELSINPGVATSLVKAKLAQRLRAKLVRLDGSKTYHDYPLVAITALGRAALTTREQPKNQLSVVMVGDKVTVPLYRCPRSACGKGTWIGDVEDVECPACDHEVTGELIGNVTVRILAVETDVDAMDVAT